MHPITNCKRQNINEDNKSTSYLVYVLNEKIRKNSLLLNIFSSMYTDTKIQYSYMPNKKKQKQRDVIASAN